VSALAIFTGQDGDRMPGRYSYEYRGTRLTYEYPTLSIKAFSDEELENSPNPFAQVILAARLRLMEEQVPEDQLLDMKLSAAKRLIKKGFDKEKIRVIFNFLRSYVLFEKPETNRKFDNQFKKIEKSDVMKMDDFVKMEAREEGLAEGYAKGQAEERRNSILALLANTEFSVQQIASIFGVSESFVDKVKKESKIG
jgi:flagellar biosynthesis/type III secretory pathway protein FliH